MRLLALAVMALVASAQDETVLIVVSNPPALDNNPAGNYAVLENECTSRGFSLVDVESAAQVHDVIRPLLQTLGHNLMAPAGVPMFFDFDGDNQYSSLADSSKDATPIIDALLDPAGPYKYTGDVRTVQANQPIGGLGWGASSTDVGVEDWGLTSHETQAVVCQTVMSPTSCQIRRRRDITGAIASDGPAIAVSGMNECASLCTNSAACRFWTYRTDMQLCWRFSTVTAWADDRTLYHSGAKDAADWEDAANCPPPACTLPASEWLETSLPPVLDVAGSGFNTGEKDIFRFSFDYHTKYESPTFSCGAAANQQLHTRQQGVSFANPTAPDAACWDHYYVDVAWEHLVPHCHREVDAAQSGFVVYTCKVTAEGTEQLSPIRSEDLTRVVHNEIPVQVKFPKQVSASIGDLSAFAPPNLLAAITRQEVNVEVSDLSVAVTINLFTSVQYPFRLISGAWDADVTATTPAAIGEGAIARSVDCTPFPTGGDAPGAQDDANACNQVWTLAVHPAGGANPALGSPCELDGDYYVSFDADCLDTFPSDCPLVQDDQGQIQNKFNVKFTLDSEYFCPQVVDSVDLSASIAVFKDHAHSISASNFVLGQTSYYVLSTSSNKVTITSCELDDLQVLVGGSPATDFVVDTVEVVGAPVTALVVENSGVNGAPANECWFQWVVAGGAGGVFDAPVDGSIDFSVEATVNVVFKDAALLLSEKVVLLQGGSQSLVAAVSSQASGQAQDETTSAAPSGAAAGASLAAIAVAAAVVARAA